MILINKLNHIFDTQSHFKMTATFIVNKVFSYYNKSDLYIHKTYIHFLRKQMHEKQTPGQLLSCEFCKNFKNTFS